jgi:hypothetical protein
VKYMGKWYTCGCGLYVHPTQINPNAYHISDCEFVKKWGVVRTEHGQVPVLIQTFNSEQAAQDAKPRMSGGRKYYVVGLVE